MPRDPIVTLVVPVYHEQDNIVSLFNEIQSAIQVPHQAIVIYDDDSDPTLYHRAAIVSNHANVEFVKNFYGKGIVNAFKTGFALVETTYVVPIMADLSDMPETVDRMYEKIVQGYDLVVASRYIYGGAKIGGPVLKYVLSKIANISLHKLSGIPVHDMTNAFIMYRREVVNSINVQSTGGFEITMELIAKAHILGYRITEVPTINRDRSAGKSHFQLWKWMGSYLHWYFYTIKYSLLNSLMAQYRRDVRREQS